MGGDIADRFSNIRKAIELKPEDPLAHFWHGRFLADREDVVASVTEFRTTLKLDAGHTEAYFYLAAGLLSQSHQEELAIDERMRLAEEAVTQITEGIQVSRSAQDRRSEKKLGNLKHMVLNDLAYKYVENSESTSWLPWLSCIRDWH